ncbi:MAG: hypothetical protein OHK0029_26230 [Armatimonadaceae bacterium]
MCVQNRKNLQKDKEDPPDAFTLEGLTDMGRLSLHIENQEVLYSSQQLDAILSVGFLGSKVRFAVEYKKSWDERDFQNALNQVLTATLPPKVHPMIVLPYLSNERLTLLEEHRVSGLDYCGNGIILGYEHPWYLRATGQPNLFSINRPLKNPYQGKSALVGRTLLSRPVFLKLQDLHEEIQKRGGIISLALVSRAVKRLEKDFIVQSNYENKVELLQPAKLLDALVATAHSWEPQLLWQGKIEIPNEGILPHLFKVAEVRKQPLIVTGLGSAPRHANLAMEKTVRVYVESRTAIESLLEGLSPRATSRFPDLEIYAAPDDAVFFDPELQKIEHNTTIHWASPLQTYLEMQTGDSRLQDSAKPLRDRIINTQKEQTLD